MVSTSPCKTWRSSFLGFICCYCNFQSPWLVSVLRGNSPKNSKHLQPASSFSSPDLPPVHCPLKKTCVIGCLKMALWIWGPGLTFCCWWSQSPVSFWFVLGLYVMFYFLEIFYLSPFFLIFPLPSCCYYCFLAPEDRISSVLICWLITVSMLT